MGVVAITGAASGIGAACAARLAAQGTRVIGVDLPGAGAGARTLVGADLGSVAGRAEAIGGVLERCGGRLDGLVTCAGLGGKPSRPGSVVAAVNYFGTVEVLAGLRPALAAAGGAAVAISSNTSPCQPGLPADVGAACLGGDEARARAVADAAGSIATYGAVKLALAHWVRREATGPTWAGAGVRLNAIAPGLVDTALAAEQREDPFVGPLVSQFPIPLGRAGRPEEVAALVALLLGDDGGFFCGSVVFLDGGTDALLRTTDWPAAWDLDLTLDLRAEGGDGGGGVTPED